MKIQDVNPKARYDNMARDLRARGFVDAAEQCERNGISIEAEYRRFSDGPLVQGENLTWDF